MRINVSGQAEFERYQKNLKAFAKQIAMLKNRLALQGEVNIRNAFLKRYYNQTGETIKIRSENIHDGVNFISDTKYSEYLENGVKRHVMKYLLKAKRPIPIDIGNKVIYKRKTQKSSYLKTRKAIKKHFPFKVEKKIIFRRCTNASIARGKWVHKGFKKDRHVNDGMGFMESGIAKTLRDGNREIENLKKLIVGK
jgi:hypothetical protein